MDNIEERMLNGMGNVADESRKFAISDKGVLGMACSGSEIGDKICLVEGCTMPVILREKTSDNGLQYQVVGKTFLFFFFFFCQRRIQRGTKGS